MSRPQAQHQPPAGGPASLEELRRRLPQAPPAELARILDDPRCGKAEVLALLLNRRAGAALLERIARDPRWRKSPAVLKRLAVHPATPPLVVRGWLENLGWADLAEVSIAPTAHATVRRKAETLLLLRLERLSSGELVALARRASRGVIARLVHSREERVLRSLLGNGRMSEALAVRLASARTAPSAFLRDMTEHAGWGCGKEVRIALVRNPRTPVSSALRVVRGLRRGDLKRLVNDDKVPKIVRVGASRILERSDRARPGRTVRRSDKGWNVHIR